MVISKSRPRRWSFNVALCAPVLALLWVSGCEGTGGDQPGRIVQQASDPRCAPLAGFFPSGLDLMPNEPSKGVVMQFIPKALLAFDLQTSPPTLLNQTASPPFPSDSDGDGLSDIEAFRDAGLCPPPPSDWPIHLEFPPCTADPKPGHVESVRDDLALVTTSNYEQVLFMRPQDGRLIELPIQNPEDTENHRTADWPLLPEAGTTALRTALSTKTCIYPDPALDSGGNPIAMALGCEEDRASFTTSFTAATAQSEAFLFVATSNLASPEEARFNPGSVLVFHFDKGSEWPQVSPHTDQPFIQTSDFNPTALANYTTTSGRPLILVTNTGEISASGQIQGDSSIDVIDVETLDLVARYPLGRAGARGAIRIDPSGRVGLLGAESRRAVYAIDLAPLDDPALYHRQGLPPIDLDGHSPNFPDGRIFWAERPLSWPGRPDGPSSTKCPTRTETTFSPSGENAYATDWCDGSITVFSIDFLSPPPDTFPAHRFTVIDRLDWFAPKTDEFYGLATAPSLIRSFEPTPSGDLDRANVVFVLNEPEGQLCTARLEY